MPRPRKSAADRRSHQVNISLTPGEAANLAARAAEARLSVAAYVRECALRRPVQVFRSYRLAAADRQALGRVGNNLNQAVKRMYMAPPFRPADRAAVLDTLAVLNAVLAEEGRR